MSSLDALKYSITVKPSPFAGIITFLLYSAVILLLLFVTPLTLLSSIMYFFLVLIAIVAAIKSYQQSTHFSLSESAVVERRLDNKTYLGRISNGSFYNGFFIFLKLEGMSSALFDKEQKQYITIYKDAISQQHYRLIARIINSGRY